MSKLTDQEYNQLCAEFIGFEVQPNNTGGLCAKFENNICNGNWNPADDANDTNKVIDKLEINVVKFGNRWQSATDNTAYESVVVHEALNKDRDTSIRQCIEAYLIEWSKQK